MKIVQSDGSAHPQPRREQPTYASLGFAQADAAKILEDPVTTAPEKKRAIGMLQGSVIRDLREIIDSEEAKGNEGDPLLLCTAREQLTRAEELLAQASKPASLPGEGLRKAA